MSGTSSDKTKVTKIDAVQFCKHETREPNLFRACSFPDDVFWLLQRILFGKISGYFTAKTRPALVRIATDEVSPLIAGQWLYKM